jgi:hypothetical protein
MQGRDGGGGYMPPTPGDAMDERARRGGRPNIVFERTEDILDELKSARGTRDPLERLTEERLMRLRGSLEGDLTLPFEVEEAAFSKWEEELSDVGGYEYDPAMKRLTITMRPGSIHEHFTRAFRDWAYEVTKTFKQEGRMIWNTNEGTSSIPRHFNK